MTYCHECGDQIVEQPHVCEGKMTRCLLCGEPAEGFHDHGPTCGEPPGEVETQVSKPDNLADLLEDVEAFVSRFVSFQSRHQAAAVALWVAHVYAIDAAPYAAYLRIKSAAEESGKTTLLEVLDLLLGPHGLNAVSVTPAAVFRLRDKVGPIALLLDEIDNTVKDRSDDGARDLLAIINSGYRKKATVVRTTGQNHEPKVFQAFGPAAIAGIGSLHPTTESRCIPITLTRKPRGQGERWIRHLVEAEGEAIAERLSKWAAMEGTIEELERSQPQLVDELRDRNVETWWGMWTIAESAGGDWPARAREAATVLHLDSDQADSQSVGVLLLGHIREAFEEDDADRLTTRELLMRLVANEEGPWGKWWGVEVEGSINAPRRSATELAYKLRGFEIRPKVIKTLDGRTPRGYMRDQFEDAWAVYLPPRNHRNHRNRPASEVAGVASVATPPGGQAEIGDAT